MMDGIPYYNILYLHNKYTFACTHMVNSDLREEKLNEKTNEILVAHNDKGIKISHSKKSGSEKRTLEICEKSIAIKMNA